MARGQSGSTEADDCDRCNADGNQRPGTHGPDDGIVAPAERRGATSDRPQEQRDEEQRSVTSSKPAKGDQQVIVEAKSTSDPKMTARAELTFGFGPLTVNLGWKGFSVTDRANPIVGGGLAGGEIKVTDAMAK